MSMFVATVSQLIDCQPSAAFAAFADAGSITQFWLSASSGSLSKDARVTWTFMVPGAADTITVTDFEVGRLIAFKWSDGSSTRLVFATQANGKTKVSVEVQVVAGDDLIEQVMNTTEGFAIVLCDLKTFIESGQSAGLVRAKAELIEASSARGEA